MRDHEIGRRELIGMGLTAGAPLAGSGIALPEAAWARGRSSMLPALSGTAAGIFADEAMHVAILRCALGLEPVPTAFVTDPTTWPMS